MILRTLITGMVAALCAVSVFANVPPLDISGISGNLITRRDAEGAETEYVYDGMNPAFAGSFPLRSSSFAGQDGVAGRIDRIEYPDNSVVGFSYDKAGNILSATNADAALTFGYDPLNRVAAVTSSVLSVYSVVEYSHDKNGNRTGLTLPGNKTITYTYDEANSLETLDLSAFCVKFFLPCGAVLLVA